MSEINDSDNASVKSEIRCRICLSSNAKEYIINPCNCAGSMALVHTYCLEKWISISCKNECEVCNSNYTGKQKLKYGIFCSIPFYIWAQKSNCAIVYCYAKIWIFLYVISTILRGYKFDIQHLLLSILFLTFLVSTFFSFFLIFIYSIFKCVYSWNRWRRCQIVFILNDSTSMHMTNIQQV